jgi:S1-C subfamily serine protease
MQRKPLIFVVLSVLIILSMACSFSASSSPTQQPTEVAAQVEKPVVVEVEPTATTKPEEPSSGAATSLAEARSAVIRIVAEGSYEYPGFGAVQGMGSGSGFIISPDGIAVTNNHVVTGAARIKVYFSDGDKAYNAKILGVSECSDLAVIDIDGGGFPFLEWYDEKPELGLDVYSMGYPLGDPNFTRHKGAISKEQADGNTNWTAVSTVLEHDAIINPGNSGGPLVTENGKVVGVNYAGASQYNQYFAIPADEAIDVIEDLRNSRNVNSIGINGEAMVTEDGSFSGIWTYSVASGSPADKSGIKAGDFLIEMEGISLGREGLMTDYCDILRSHRAEDTLSLKLLRFNTGELMEGQLNGRELKTISVVDLSGTDDPDTGEAPAFFVEEFDTDLPLWTSFHFGKDNARYNMAVEDGLLTFDISDRDTYVYATYDPYLYEDVRLDAAVQNQGGNNNFFSLVCRLDEEKGWYEFNVSSGGLWSLLRYDVSTSKFNLLYNGGSFNINMGQDENIFSLECRGNEISAYINNKLMKTVTDKRISEGLVGISVSAFDQVPVTVSFDTLVISEP